MKVFLTTVVAGYVIAVLVAVIVTEILFLVPSVLFDQGGCGSLIRIANDLPWIFFVGLAYTSITALPGFCITVIVASRNRWHGWQYYSACGAATALLAHFILAVPVHGVTFEPYLVLVCSMPGGAAGAYAYFLWRQKILSARVG